PQRPRPARRSSRRPLGGGPRLRNRRPADTGRGRDGAPARRGGRPRRQAHQPASRASPRRDRALPGDARPGARLPARRTPDAGVAAIAGLTFSVIALSLGKYDAAVLSAIVFGACVGFLRHNFYPARIIMGDSGALLLGYVLATIAVQGLLKTAASVALFFPLLVLAVPIVDTTFVVVRRLKHGEPVFEADQAHLHHRFLRRG